MIYICVNAYLELQTIKYYIVGYDVYIYLHVSVLTIVLLYWRTSSSFSMMSALRKNSHTLTGEPKKATCPLQSRRILSKAWKISLLGWWMVTTTALPVPAISWRLLRISRDEAESRPIRRGRKMGG